MFMAKSKNTQLKCSAKAYANSLLLLNGLLPNTMCRHISH